MERKIGEIFEYNGEWYQCVKSDGTCNGCVGKFQSYSFCNGFKECVGKIFTKLEKVGEPIKVNGKVIQTLKLHTSRCECEDCCFYRDKETGACCKDSPCRPYEIFVEIKQNQEDMEENKLNLKPFCLEAAKLGKPVCTRDGRKARIICFDRDWDMHIVALVSNPLGESVHYYLSNGKVDFDKQNDEDLMMLPEKHEGWVNILRYSNDNYVDNIIYATEELAKKAATKKNGVKRIATVKIEWEE